MTKCQFHSNCGGYCNTPKQVASNMCENCQDAEQMDTAARVRTTAIVDAATELLDVLDAAANVDEPSPGQREWMERLRTALAA